MPSIPSLPLTPHPPSLPPHNHPIATPQFLLPFHPHPFIWFIHFIHCTQSGDPQGSFGILTDAKTLFFFRSFDTIPLGMPKIDHEASIDWLIDRLNGWYEMTKSSLAFDLSVVNNATSWWSWRNMSLVVKSNIFGGLRRDSSLRTAVESRNVLTSAAESDGPGRIAKESPEHPRIIPPKWLKSAAGTTRHFRAISEQFRSSSSAVSNHSPFYLHLSIGS